MTPKIIHEIDDDGRRIERFVGDGPKRILKQILSPGSDLPEDREESITVEVFDSARVAEAAEEHRRPAEESRIDGEVTAESWPRRNCLAATAAAASMTIEEVAQRAMLPTPILEDIAAGGEEEVPTEDRCVQINAVLPGAFPDDCHPWRQPSPNQASGDAPPSAPPRTHAPGPSEAEFEDRSKRGDARAHDAAVEAAAERERRRAAPASRRREAAAARRGA